MTRILLALLLFAGCNPTPRPASEPVSPALAVALARPGQPDDHPGARPTRTRFVSAQPPSSTVTGSSPEPTRKTRTAPILRGTATWFRSPAGVSAAGPDLRAALGPGWRGTHVTVCSASRCVETVLGDWMRADRLIDLHAPLFARLAPLSRGVLTVSVTP